MDNDHAEASEMWEYNATNLHPLRNNKDSIASYVNIGTNKVKSSIPSATFKNGMYPSTMQTYNYNENVEEDTQPTDQTMSPLEYAGLMAVRFALPGQVERKVKPHNYAGGLDYSVVRKGKWKTSNGAKTKNIQFAPYQRTGTSIHTFKGARGNKGANKSVLSGGPDDSFITSEVRAPPLKKVHTILNKEVATAAFNVIKKWMLSEYKTLLDPMSDPDIAILIRSGIDYTSPSFANQVQEYTGYSLENISAALRGVAGFIAQIKSNRIAAAKAAAAKEKADKAAAAKAEKEAAKAAADAAAAGGGGAPP